MKEIVIPKSHIRALLEYGLTYNRDRRCWDGLDYSLGNAAIRDLDLWELDQVLAGLRDRVKVVRIKRGFFYMNLEQG